MRKYLSWLIAIIGTIGLLINVLVFSFDDGFNLFRGLGAFRYYTLQSNFLVVSYFYASHFRKISENSLFKRYLGAITIYITITFVVFVIFLQPGYHPKGWHAVGNISLHYIVPILTIFHMIKYHNDYRFESRDYLWWMVYPLLYVVFMIVYGSISGDYIYPFFQVSEIGIMGLIFTIILLVIFFILLSFLLMKIVSKKQNTKHE